MATVRVDPVTSTLAIDTVPSGIPVFLDGQAVATPALVESTVGFQHALQAQASFELGGAAHDFGCWSDGGSAAHVLVAPVGGMSLTATYDAAPQAGASVPVAAQVRNADHYPPAGQAYSNLYDAFGLCFGRDGGGPYQTGLQFALDVPQGAAVLAASIQMVATADQVGSPQAAVAAYDVADAPPFAAGSATALVDWAPLTAASLSWSPPDFTPGVAYVTPDLAALVQAVVDRPDWAPGNSLGLVFDGSPTAGDAWRCLRNYDSGQPAVLSVTYATGSPGGAPCAGACGFTTYGLAASPANVLGLVGTGSPVPGGSVQIRTTGLGSAPGAWTVASSAASSLPVLGGVGLADLGAPLALVFLPAAGGQTVWTVALGANPALAGLSVYFQSAAPDAGQPQGWVFSAGLELAICP